MRWAIIMTVRYWKLSPLRVAWSVASVSVSMAAYNFGVLASVDMGNTA